MSSVRNGWTSSPNRGEIHGQYRLLGTIRPLPPRSGDQSSNRWATLAGRSTDMKRSLLDATAGELKAWIEELGYPSFHANQVLRWVFQRRAAVRGDVRPAQGLASATRRRMDGLRHPDRRATEVPRWNRQAPSGLSRRPTYRMCADGRGGPPDRLYQHPGRLWDGMRFLRQWIERGRAEPDPGRDRRAGDPAATTSCRPQRGSPTWWSWGWARAWPTSRT